MSDRAIGPQDECVQCYLPKSTIRRSQRQGGLHVLFCATVDYWGEVEGEWGRHKFMWTQADQDCVNAENAYWEAAAKAMGQ